MNCDREAGEAVVITVRTPSGGAATFALCGTCYAEVYGPLVAHLERIGERKSHDGNVVVFTHQAGR